MSRTKKLIGIVLLCITAGAAAWQIDWTPYVQGWFGIHFKLLSGAMLGFVVDRYFLGNDLSMLPDASKPLAALQRAIMVVGFAIGAATGV